MPFGSIFKKIDYIEALSADNVEVVFKNNFFTRLGFAILGVPHIGLRLRALKIIKNAPKRIESMLDAGCGTGVYSFSLAEKAKKIDAIDFEAKKIDYDKRVNRFKNIRFQCMDLRNLKFKKNSFDFVICSDVIEHIKQDEKAISEISRVMKKRGRLLLTVPSLSKKNIETYKSYSHERPGYSAKKLGKLCARHGLELVRVEYYSCALTEKFSNLSYKFLKNKILIGILFYPLYLGSILADMLFSKTSNNGLFAIIVKK